MLSEGVSTVGDGSVTVGAVVADGSGEAIGSAVLGIVEAISCVGVRAPAFTAGAGVAGGGTIVVVGEGVGVETSVAEAASRRDTKSTAPRLKPNRMSIRTAMRALSRRGWGSSSDCNSSYLSRCQDIRGGRIETSEDRVPGGAYKARPGASVLILRSFQLQKPFVPRVRSLRYAGGERNVDLATLPRSEWLNILLTPGATTYRQL